MLCPPLTHTHITHLRIARASRGQLALTDGPRPARLYAAGAAWTLEVPQLERVVNAIGAGDVCTGVFTHALVCARAAAAAASAPLPPSAAVDCFAWGLAAACARCMHELPTAFERSEVEALHAQIRIEQVK